MWSGKSHTGPKRLMMMMSQSTSIEELKAMKKAPMLSQARHSKKLSQSFTIQFWKSRMNDFVQNCMKDFESFFECLAWLSIGAFSIASSSLILVL